NRFTGWRSGNEKIMYLFSSHIVSMNWDYGEANILADVVGGFISNLNYQAKCLKKLPEKNIKHGFSIQKNARTQKLSVDKIISTDPSYYDNIGYANLSDFFYLWMRHNLKDIYPELFSTLTVPKFEELIATPFRHDSSEKAESFFF